MKKKGNQLIVVLGMHRSGTSAITRGLEVMGVDLGGDLLPPMEGVNDKGFWEDAELNAFNIELLNYVESDWHFLTPIRDHDVDRLRDNEYVERALNILQKKTISSPIFGFKDPRVAKLLPFWKDVFAESGFTIGYILMIRNPLSVARSLFKRDGFSAGKSYLMWTEHVLNSIIGTVGETRVLVDYDRLMQNPNGELLRIAQAFDLEIVPARMEKFKEEFLDEDLRHSLFQSDDVINDPLVPSLLKEVYRETVKASVNTNYLESTEFEKCLARWIKEFSFQEPAFALVDELTIQVLEKEKLMQKLSMDNLILSNQVQDLFMQVQGLSMQIQDLSSHAEELSAQIEKYAVSLSKKTEEVLRVSEERDLIHIELKKIVSSKFWKIIVLLGKFRLFIVPLGSFQYRFIRYLLRLKGGLFTAIVSFVSLVRKVVSFSRSHGVKVTFVKIVRKIRASEENGRYSYDFLIKSFPDKFKQANVGISKTSRIAAVDFQAEKGVKKLLQQLELDVDSVKLLNALKSRFGKEQYYQILNDFFLYLRAIESQPLNIDRQIIQASELPLGSPEKQRRKILFITSQFPNLFHGGGNRILNFIKILSEQNDVYLAASYYDQEDKTTADIIAPYCRSILKIPYWQFGGNQAEIKKWLKDAQADVVHYEWPLSLENYDPGYGRYQVFTYMEAVSLRLLMDLRQIETLSVDWTDKFSQLIHALRMEVFDASFMDSRIAVTTKDGEFFRKLYPGQEYVVLNHGVNFDEFDLPDVEPEPNTLVFVGNYVHYPNTDAMLFFFNEIWDRVRKEIPDVKIYLIGYNPPPELTKFADGKQVIITGAVSDIRPYIQKASVCVAPLISGAGLRGKVIDYAALRRTFIATSIAVTDLVFKDGIDYLAAETAEDFSRKIIYLLKNDALRRQLSESAYQTARKNYDTRRLVNFLCRLYDHLEKG